jgi:predicted RNA-binding Zn-ribbon protein involved in translation (DUF1610 family)
MKNVIIDKFRKQMNEPNRTRPFIRFVCWRCNKEIVIAESLHLDEKPCKGCCRSILAEQRFFKRAKEKFGDKFDLSEVLYINSTTKVKVRCTIHNHSYYINPSVFVGKGYSKLQIPQKGGCKYCATESSKQYLHKPIEYYLNKLKERFPKFEVIAHGNASSNTEWITLKCPNHGIFKTRLSKIMTEHTVYLCPKCANEMLAWNTRTTRIDVKGFVYLFYIKELNLYKLGVTHRKITKRAWELEYSSNHSFDLKWLLELKTLADAFTIELFLFRKYKNFLNKEEIQCKFGGYSELLTKEIEKPSKRFIEEILCLKESNSEKLLTSNVEDNPEPSCSNTKGATTISKESTLK